MKKSHLILTAVTTLLGAGVAAAQDLYVSDTASNQITVIASGGATTILNSADLDQPTGLAYNNGNLYIADQGDGDITEYNTSTGVFSQFYTGTALTDPRGLAFDSNGNLYVANSGADSIVKFTGSTPAVYATSLSSPNALAIATNGVIYATEGGNNTVAQIFPLSGSGFVLPFYPVTGSPTPSTPQGITFGPNGDLFVVNQTNVTGAGTPAVFQVSLLPMGGISISNNPPTPGNLSSPVGDAFDTSGFLYVADNGNNTVTEYVRNPGSGGTYTLVQTFSEGLSGPSFLAFAPGPAAPEPGTYAMLLGGLAVLYFYQRRRTATPVKI